MPASRRRFISGGAAAGLLTITSGDIFTDALTPEMFGAKGDGRSNDTHAFQVLSDRVNARGGGTIFLRTTTYIVGQHEKTQNALDARAGPFAFGPGRILQFVNCSSPVRVWGNGARLKAANGLRYGAFDWQLGTKIDPPLPFTNRRHRASPYHAMVEAMRCSALIEICDLELDGNLNQLEIGGKWGDAGRQIPGSGILLTDNTGPERLCNVYSHHQPLDGLKIAGPNVRTTSSTISDTVCEYNVRQGCSITGGTNYSFLRCRFRNTGKSTLKSAPRAGLDIEPAGAHIVRNLTFIECEFSNNDGPGMAAGTSKAANAKFEKCTFVGTTNWSAWPNMPGVQFRDCDFVGAITQAYGATDPSVAAQFHDCRFRDDPSLSPTGQVYSEPRRSHSIAVLRRSRNVLFDRCDFRLTQSCTLPWTTAEVIFEDCRMSQRSEIQSYPRGTYRGTNIITGNADIAGSLIRGEVLLNGQRIGSGSL